MEATTRERPGARAHHYGFDGSAQYYRIVDPQHPDVERLILVQTPVITDLLTNADYMFA